MLKIPDPIDIHVGSRVRLRRTLLGMSQQNLGSALGLTFQQIQKYEKGSNRIGASNLYKLSKILDVPVAFFFEELPRNVEADAKCFAGKEQESFEQSCLGRRETLELARAYYKISDTKLRKRIFELVKAVAYA